MLTVLSLSQHSFPPSPAVCCPPSINPPPPFLLSKVPHAFPYLDPLRPTSLFTVNHLLRSSSTLGKIVLSQNTLLFYLIPYLYPYVVLSSALIRIFIIIIITYYPSLFVIIIIILYPHEPLK